ncbi:major pollen allergen Lol p 11-like [Curcuma longa]|uniref:major pollen allergen Lol p 11-like n=1 Tax=Curcuma longa TaxID=136217 RepID=UPI003D9DC1B1
MAKHLILASAALFAVACVLPSIAFAARGVAGVKPGFVVQGRVFCDTCRAGFETPASTYVTGAKVKVECRQKATGETTSSFEGTTDHTGTYNILVAGEHEDEMCESMLVSSPESGCKATLQGREKAPVFLSSNNGIASATRYANSLGFQKDTPLPECAQLLKVYELDDEEEN